MRLQLVQRAERAGRMRGQALLARAVAGVPDERVERRFGNRLAQAVIFGVMARSFRPEHAGGFEGEIVYELTYPRQERAPDAWTVSVAGRSARSRRGRARSPRLCMRMPVVDFARIAARQQHPAVPLLAGRISVEGDLAVAMRLAGMFGGRTPGRRSP